MSTSNISYPENLPGPVWPGYDFQHEDPMMRTPFRSGRARYRLAFTSVPSHVKVKFAFTSSEQAAQFEWWYHDTLKDGVLWFNMPLITPAGEKKYLAHFVKIYSGPTLYAVDAWEFTAELELWERPLSETGPGPGPDPDPDPDPGPDPDPSDCPSYPTWIASTWSGYVTSSSATAPAFAPGAIQAGDLLLLTIFARVEPASVPSGFTEVVRSPFVGDLNSFMVVYKKVADGSEASFPISMSASERMCVNVAAFQGARTPEVEGASGWLQDASGWTFNEFGPLQVSNPSSEHSGLVIVGAATSLAITGTADLITTVNIPFYGWEGYHNSNGTSRQHQNRMMLCGRTMGPGESMRAYSPYITMTHEDGFSMFKLLVLVPESS